MWILSLLCSGLSEKVKVLIDLGANLDARDNSMETPLHKAASHGNFRRIQPESTGKKSKLYRFSVQIKVKRWKFSLNTARMLILKIMGDWLLFIKPLLLVIFLSLCTKRSKQKFFTFSGYLETVKILVAKGADINVLTKSKDGKHAAELAMKGGN